MAKFRSKVQTGWTFANVRLDKTQRQEFLDWHSDSSEDVSTILATVLLTGYKLSAKWDEENETWIATLTGFEDNKHNPSTSMSARHSDFETALALVAYKHVVICNSVDWATYTDTESWG